MRFLLLLVLLNLISPQFAYGWGERGHAAVARVAVRLLVEKSREPAMRTPFVGRELMLAHLANIPDIAWGISTNLDVRSQNFPTHYMNMEKLLNRFDFGFFPRSPTEAVKLAKQKGYELSQVGTAPWRVQQFYALMVESLKTSGTRPIDQRDPTIQEALVPAGIMAHFIGDLANPMHTTKNFDGWDTTQGGFHFYFEVQVVDALPLTLENDVFVSAVTHKPYAKLDASIKKDKDHNKLPGLLTAIALQSQSHIFLPELLALDVRRSIIEPSKDIQGTKINAKRQDPAAVAKFYNDLIVQRLAIAADALSELWYRAWLDAGKPDLSQFKLYDYPINPAFIKPNYLPN